MNSQKERDLQAAISLIEGDAAREIDDSKAFTYIVQVAGEEERRVEEAESIHTPVRAVFHPAPPTAVVACSIIRQYTIIIIPSLSSYSTFPPTG
jgi:hypothetical protein